MKVLLLMILASLFCLCVGAPQVVNVGDLDKVKVLNISEELNNSSLKFIFSVENKFGALQVEDNESDLGMYANGIKIGEAIYYDKELKEGLNELEVIINLNSTNLKEFLNAHISGGERSLLVVRAYLVYKLDGSFLRIFHTKSDNFTTNLLPNVNEKLCNISFNLSSEWGNLTENETEVLYRLKIVSESEKKLSLKISSYVNDVLISTSENEINLKSGSNEILLNQRLSASEISKLLNFRNIFKWKIEVETPEKCLESFERSSNFDLVVK